MQAPGITKSMLRPRLGLLLLISLSIAVCGGTPARAQERLGIEPPRCPGPVEPTFPAPQEPPLRPLPELPPVPLPPPEERERLPMRRVFVRQILVTGSTVFSEQDLAAVTAPYVNRSVTS